MVIDCNTITLILTLILIVIFFLILLPLNDNYYKKKIKEQLTLLNQNNIDDENDKFKIDLNECSRDCCKYTQWKLPPEIALSNDKQYSNFIPTNLSCNWGKNSGCVCLDQKQFNYLSSRGYKSD
jgi:hypothetical protein